MASLRGRRLAAFRIHLFVMKYLDLSGYQDLIYNFSLIPVTRHDGGSSGTLITKLSS